MEEDDSASCSSADERSTTDGVSFVKVRPKLSPLRPNAYSRAKTSSPTVRQSADIPQERVSSHDNHHYRRRSLPHNDAQWHNEDITPTERSHRQKSWSPRSRTLSITSGSETTDDASTSREGSISSTSTRYEEVHKQLPRPYYDKYGRRHSAYSPYDERDHMPHLHLRKQQTLSPHFFATHTSVPRPQSVVYQQSPKRAVFPQRSPPQDLSGPQIQLRDTIMSYGGPSNAANPTTNRPNVDFCRRDSNYFDDRPRRQATEPMMASAGRRYPTEASTWK